MLPEIKEVSKAIKLRNVVVRLVDGTFSDSNAINMS